MKEAGALEAAVEVGRHAIRAAEARVVRENAKWASRTTKRANDYTTDLDIDVERTMRDILGTTGDVGVGVLGEELGGVADLGSGTNWVIDPIDGTTNVLRQIPTFSVTLALVIDGEAVMSFVSAPLLGERYVAVKGNGAYAETGATRHRLHVSATVDLGAALVGVNDIAGLRDRRERTMAGAEIGPLAAEAFQIRCHGSIALDLAWVAAGRLDACIAYSNRPWDVQAGALLVREASGDVYDRDGTPHTLLSTLTLASSPGLRDAILAQLSRPA